VSGTHSLLGEQWQRGVKQLAKNRTEKAHIFLPSPKGLQPAISRSPAAVITRLRLSNVLTIAPIRHHYWYCREVLSGGGGMSEIGLHNIYMSFSTLRLPCLRSSALPNLYNVQKVDHKRTFHFHLPHIASYLQLLVLASCLLSYILFVATSYYALTYPISSATAVSHFSFFLSPILFRSFSVSRLSQTHTHTHTHTHTLYISLFHMNAHSETTTHIGLHPFTHTHT